MKSSTFCIFTSTTIRAVLAPADTLSDHAARQARSAGTSAGVHDIFIDPGDFDFERSAASGAAIQLGPHHPSWPAGKVADAAAGDPWLSGRCVYRKSKSERIDDEVRPVWRANLGRRIAEPSERQAHPCSMTDAFSRRCNSPHSFSESDADVPCPRQ